MSRPQDEAKSIFLNALEIASPPERRLYVDEQCGFGVVFMAEQTERIRRKVTRFEAERQALAIMDHPNIAKVLDGGSTADRFDRERLLTSFDEMRRIIRDEEPPKPSTRLSTLGQAVSTISENRRTDSRQLSQLVRGELDLDRDEGAGEPRSRLREPAKRTDDFRKSTITEFARIQYGAKG